MRSGGNMNKEATVNRKGRVFIPAHLRQELGLGEGAKVKMALEEGKIIIVKPITPEEFIHKMEGCIKENPPIPRANPLKLKGIWGKQ
jgi:AbrB family looped-hinge helix DNA binding protein